MKTIDGSEIIYGMYDKWGMKDFVQLIIVEMV